MTDLVPYCSDLAKRAHAAAGILATATGGQKNAWLLHAADALLQSSDKILQANEQDVTAAGARGLTTAQIDRLRLTPARLQAAASGMREVAALPEPIGRVLDSSVR